MRNFFVLLSCVFILASCTQKPAKVEDYSGEFFDRNAYSDLLEREAQKERAVAKKKKSIAALKRKKEQVKRAKKAKKVATNVATGGAVIKVKKGDTLYGLANRHKVFARDIIDANNLKAPYVLEIGQRLKVVPARYYKVKRGDALYKVANKFDVSMKRLITANNLKKPYGLEIGQQLKIPHLSDYKKTAASKSKIAKKTSSQKSSKKAKKKSYKLSTPSKFSWPTRGKIISSFGAKSGKIHNDGINIAAREGASVKAAASGEVVYTGNGLKGYGNLIILKHGGGYLTAYAHNKKFEVEKGDYVKKGQLIGYVGSTGNVSRSQLHFAIRKGKNPVNPLKYLRG